MAHIYRRGVSAIGEEPERTEKKRKDTEKNGRVIYFAGGRIVVFSLSVLY